MTKAEAKAAMALHHRRGISLKAAWAQVKHGVRASPGGTRRTGTSKPSNGSSPKGGRVGRWYQGASSGLGVLAPLGDEAASAFDEHRMPTLGNVKNKVFSVPYAENLAVEGATAIVDKKMGQAAALSRGSATAIGAEVLLVMGTNARRGSIRQTHRAWSVTRNGYDPQDNYWSIQDPYFRTYRLVKHGGQIVRKLRTRSAQRGGVISRLLEPVGEYILRPVGLTW